MNVIRNHDNLEAQLAEYSAVRAEIEQLNGQIFSVLSGSLALDVSILGWLFGEHGNPRVPYLLPTVGILFLMAGNYILLNRNRLAHRLALFQKYFVESRQPAICWARVGSQYRIRYSKDAGRFASFVERLADSGSWVLFGASVLNILVLLLLPYLTSSGAAVDRVQLGNFIHSVLDYSPRAADSRIVVDWPQFVNLLVASAFAASELFLLGVMRNYERVECTMRQLADEAGLLT